MKNLLEYVKTQAKFSGRQLLSFDKLAEFPAEQAEELQDKGIIRQIKDDDGIMCTECDEPCRKPVETRSKNGKPIGVIYCEDEDCGGLVEVELERLQQWEIVKKKLLGVKKDNNKAETIYIDMELFSEGPSKDLLKDLILKPTGVAGNNQDVKNLRDALRDSKGDEYETVATNISKVRNKNLICVKTENITLKVKE